MVAALHPEVFHSSNPPSKALSGKLAGQGLSCAFEWYGHSGQVSTVINLIAYEPCAGEEVALSSGGPRLGDRSQVHSFNYTPET